MFPGKESPWSVLGLDSAAATLRDVKRSYAKLLKQHRPDSDPDGFRRVHDAYQIVLRELEIRDHPDGLSAAVPEALPLPDEPAKPPPAPAAALPPPFLTALEKLRASSAPAEAVEALDQLRAACGQDAGLWRAWGDALTAVLGTATHPGLAAAIPPADVLSALRAGAAAAALRILDLWHSEKHHVSMVAVGKVLTARGAFKDYDHPGTGFFVLRLAFNLAIAQPGGANLLLDAAFSWLPPETRSAAMPPVEGRLSIGRLFWHVPVTWQGFWENALDELAAGRKPDWAATEARRAINDLLRVTPADWPGWGFIQSQVSEVQWQDIVMHFNSRPYSRRSWAAPPERAWINTGPGENAAFSSRHPLQKQLTPDDDWSIPEAPADLAESKRQTWTTTPNKEAVQMKDTRPKPAPHHSAVHSRLTKTLLQYYRIPRPVRILLLFILTCLAVFVVYYLIRKVERIRFFD